MPLLQDRVAQESNNLPPENPGHTRVLEDPAWAERLTHEDRRALNPLFWAHINPYGRFDLDMDKRLDLAV